MHGAKTLRVLTRSKLAEINRASMCAGFEKTLSFREIDSLPPFRKFPIIWTMPNRQTKHSKTKPYVRVLIQLGIPSRVGCLDMDLASLQSLPFSRVNIQ